MCERSEPFVITCMQKNMNPHFEEYKNPNMNEILSPGNKYKVFSFSINIKYLAFQ